MTGKRLFVALLKPWSGGYEIHLSEVVFPQSGGRPISADAGVMRCQGEVNDDDAMRMASDYLETMHNFGPHEYDLAILSFVWEDLC